MGMPWEGVSFDEYADATDDEVVPPLSSTATGEDLTDEEKSVLRSADGEIMAVPVTVSAIGGVYNTTAMDELGLTPPTTWSELLGFCHDATASGRVAYGLGLKDAWTSQFVSYALGQPQMYGVRLRYSFGR